MSEEFNISHIVQCCLRFNTYREVEHYLTGILPTDSPIFFRKLVRYIWDQATQNGFEHELCNRIEWNPFILDYNMIYIETFNAPVDVYCSILRFAYSLMENDF
jgi:hypothetical protein